MYKKVDTDKSFKRIDGEAVSPVATMKDEFGGVIQIIEDDHCYVVYIKVGKNYVATPYLSKEVHEVLCSLPALS